MAHDHELPPEGLLIEEARERLGFSQNQAGALADMHGNWWRAMVYGKKSDGTPVIGRPDTWARMALVVGLTPESFERLDPPRRDVADLMRTFASLARDSMLTGHPESSLLSLLAAIQTAFGPEACEDAIQGAVQAVARRQRIRTRRKRSTEEGDH